MFNVYLYLLNKIILSEMKTLKTITKIFIVIASITTFVACSNDDDDQPVFMPETIAELALVTPNLQNLVAALDRAGLVETLNSPGSYTVFAPTDDAFSEFLAANNFGSLEAVPLDLLTQVLLNHVVAGEFPSNSLTTGYVNTLATQEGTDLNLSMFVDVSTSVTLNGVSDVETPDIDATNGIIHIVDAVIGLPTVVDHALANNNFGNLVAALGAADGDLVTTLSTGGPFTILAPDDDAFATFLNGAALGDVPTDALANILLNHVINDVVLTSSDLVAAESGYTNTLATGPESNNLSIYFDATDGVMFNGVSTVTAADIVGTNGIIHAVDAVIDLPTIATFATSNSALESLVAALAYADTGSPTVPYITTVSDAEAGPFTVFAPTNDAFVSLLADDLMLDNLTDIPTATVDAVLLMHIVNANVQSGILSSGAVPTLGGDITADATAFTLTDANDRVSNIITSLVDIQAINGVVHVIDKVILPAP